MPEKASFHLLESDFNVFGGLVLNTLPASHEYLSLARKIPFFSTNSQYCVRVCVCTRAICIYKGIHHMVFNPQTTFSEMKSCKPRFHTSPGLSQPLKYCCQANVLQRTALRAVHTARQLTATRSTTYRSQD